MSRYGGMASVGHAWTSDDVSKLYSEHKVLEPGTPDRTVARKKALGFIKRKPTTVRGQRALVEMRTDDGGRQVYRAGGELASSKEVKEFSIGKAEYDPYAPQKKNPLISGSGAAVLGGTGLTALGVRNIRDSKTLPETATARAHNAGIKHAEVVGRQNRALTNAARQEAIQTHTRTGAKWMRTGKLRRARKELELVSQEADRSKAAMALRHAERSPAQLALRGKHLGRGGKALVAGGIATATAPIWTRPFRKNDEEIRKTITQARYGGNAEAGRAWRGKEKKDAKAPTIAAAGLGVGTAGVGAALAGRRRLRDVGPEVKVAPAKDEAGAAARHAHEAGKATTAANRSTTSAASLTRAQELDREWRKTKHGEHPHARQPAPDYPGHKRGPAGKVGVAGGGWKFMEGHAKKEAAEAAREAHFTGRAEAVARHEHHAAATHNATRHATAEAANKTRLSTIKGSKRLIRGGKAAAAVGGLAAVAAGVKAEQDRRTGFGKPKRPRQGSRPFRPAP
jgi:hypothetical protein